MVIVLVLRQKMIAEYVLEVYQVIQLTAIKIVMVIVLVKLLMITVIFVQVETVVT